MKAHLNPFAPDRVQRLLPFDPQLIDTSWEALESRWQKLGRRAAIIGHKGSGKTTFLRTFATRLEDSHDFVRLFFRQGDRTLGQTELKQLQEIQKGRKAILLIDGEGHLSLTERHRLRNHARKAEGYLVARHHRSLLPTLCHLRSSHELASALLARMDLKEQEALQSELPHLLRKKRGNLREVWLSLFDEYATKPNSDPSSGPPHRRPARSGL